nr:hypothetical protein [Stenotrophomonas indicatrix]
MTGDFEATGQASVHGYGKFHRAIVVIAAHADALLAVVEEILAAGFTFSIGRERVNNLTRRSLVDHDRFRILAKDALVRDVDFGTESGPPRLKHFLEFGVRDVDTGLTECVGITTCARPSYRGLSLVLRRLIHISSQSRHFTRMVGFLQALGLFFIPTFAQLLYEKILLVDCARTRLVLRTTHGNLHCTLKCRLFRSTYGLPEPFASVTSSANR